MSKKDSDVSDELRQMKELARTVIAHHFGSKPRRIIHKASGLSNFVFSVVHPEGDFIVRISPEPARINSFIKEQWAQGRAREIGVPTPEILEVGNEIIGHPFMISRTVGGHEATYNPNRMPILREMGRYSALINTIPTIGFGSTFDWSSNLLSHNATWNEYLQKELRLEARLETLERNQLLISAQIKKLRRILEKADETEIKPTLNHGDIRLKNMIVNEQGEITAILDWEHCTSNLAPHWELSLALHDLSIDEKQEFLMGYGLEDKRIVEIAPVMKALNIINYAPKIECLVESKDTRCLEQYRTRLSGALDFYSLS
ncbi:MAG: phosphotransferase [Pyrinomonadaceae bacterium]